MPKYTICSLYFYTSQGGVHVIFMVSIWELVFLAVFFFQINIFSLNYGFFVNPFLLLQEKKDEHLMTKNFSSLWRQMKRTGILLCCCAAYAGLRVALEKNNSGHVAHDVLDKKKSLNVWKLSFCSFKQPD